MTLQEVLEKLQQVANPEKILLKRQKFGISAKHSLGIYHQDLKEIAKQIGSNNDLAIELFDSGIYEARILCSKIYNPAALTEEQMDQWVATFENWEICDSFCMGFFAKSKFALVKAKEWSRSEKEFIKRAGFVIMASYGFADKKAPNAVFEEFFPYIEKESTDQRIYVKKAVNWALRNIGKRNKDLQASAILTAERLLKLPEPTAVWIAKDALRELTSPRAKLLDYPRSLYR